MKKKKYFMALSSVIFIFIFFAVGSAWTEEDYWPTQGCIEYGRSKKGYDG